MDKWIYTIDMFLSYGISGYVMFKFMFALFQPKYSKKVYVLPYIIFVLLSFYVNQLNIPLFKSFYGIGAICIISTTLFKSASRKRLIGASLFFFLYMFIIDTLSVLLFSVFSGRTMEEVMGN